jgi:hypothetical protein
MLNIIAVKTAYTDLTYSNSASTSEQVEAESEK